MRISIIGAMFLFASVSFGQIVCPYDVTTGRFVTPHKVGLNWENLEYVCEEMAEDISGELTLDGLATECEDDEILKADTGVMVCAADADTIFDPEDPIALTAAAEFSVTSDTDYTLSVGDSGISFSGVGEGPLAIFSANSSGVLFDIPPISEYFRAANALDGSETATVTISASGTSDPFINFSLLDGAEAVLSDAVITYDSSDDDFEFTGAAQYNFDNSIFLDDASTTDFAINFDAGGAVLTYDDSDDDIEFTGATDYNFDNAVNIEGLVLIESDLVLVGSTYMRNLSGAKIGTNGAGSVTICSASGNYACDTGASIIVNSADDDRATIIGCNHFGKRTGPPTTPAPAACDMYFDTNSSPPALCVYDGSAWNGVPVTATCS